MPSSRQDTAKGDGGYFAIKGFVFQFDKSILEALMDNKANIEIEQIQDIGTASYYIQVKHKESQNYSPSKVRPAIIQLIKESQSNKTKKYVLYCYFKDKTAQKQALNKVQLGKILGKENDKFSDKAKDDFLRIFTLEFSDDFRKQFKIVISQIKKSFNLKSFEEAAMYHATFRASIIEIAIQKKPNLRKINFDILRDLLINNEKIIFEIAYPKYLTNSKYLAYLKREYFTHKKVNIRDHERLFVIGIDHRISDIAISKIVCNITSKYYVQDNSGAPYICLSGIDDSRSSKIKQKLWDTNFLFSDGTHFSGDIFRFQSIIEKLHKIPHNKVRCKLVSQPNLKELLDKYKFDEVFSFLSPNAKDVLENGVPAKKFYLNQTVDILKVIE